MMKKAGLLFLVVLLCFVLSSCATLAVRCGVDRQNTAYLYITYRADLSDFAETDRIQIKESLNRIVGYYDNTLHYQVETEGLETGNDADDVTIDMKLSRTGDSTEEALANLEDMLTDEKLSPFSTLVLTHSGGDKEITCRFRGTVDGAKVFADTGIEAFPKAMSDKLNQAFTDSSVTLTVTLPATEVLSKNGEVAQNGAYAEITVPISMTEETALAMNTRSRLFGGKLLDAQTEKQRDIGRIVICVVLVLGIIAVLAALYRRAVKKQKQNLPPTDITF